MGLTTSDLMARLTSPYMEGGNVQKLMQAIYDGLWAGVETNILDLETQRYIKTATGGSLDRHAKAVKLVRRSGESDASLRLRIAGEIKRFVGGTNPDSILEFVASFLGASHGDVTLVENRDVNGNFRPRYYRIIFDVSILGTLGFPESEWASVIEEINRILDRVSAAGIKGEVVVEGGATWDADMYDTSGDVWGA